MADDAQPEEQIAWARRYIKERYGLIQLLRDVPLENVAEFLLTAVAGLDTTDPQEQRTPARFVQALRDMTTPEAFAFTVFDVDEGALDEMIVERNIPFASLCRHHILPFTGVAHVGYVPKKKMAGLSKLARAVKYHAAGLRTQEELTVQIGRYIEEKLDPLGVAVVMEGEHTCMTLRGVKAPGALTSTQVMYGVFGDHERTAKAEFLDRINHGR